MRKEILIRESAGIERTGEYVRVALPCRRGELQPDTALCLAGPDDTPIPCQRRMLKAWPDGSVKWLLLDFHVRFPAGGALSYQVCEAPVGMESAPAIQIVPGAGQWLVHTGAGTFCIDSLSYRPLLSVQHGGRDLLAVGKSACHFSIDGVTNVSPKVELIEVEEAGPLHAVLHLTGSIPSGMAGGVPGAGFADARFSSRLHFFADSMVLRVEFTIHNSQAARHPGGLWDLGDPGALLFRELSFVFGLPTAASGELRLWADPEGPLIEAAASVGLMLYQESSGGANWRSANHRNSAGKVVMERRGYLVESLGKELASGLRAAPTIWFGTRGGTGLAAALPHFWQDFPKAIGASEGEFKIELYPARYPDLHELQGGEEKTHAFVLDFAAQPGPLACAVAPLWAATSPRDYRESGIFQDLPAEDDLVDLFAAPADILAKREALDEYGWRNFGELPADHEALYCKGSETFVSHYNNQYDFCAGAYRKAFATGDSGWRDLAADLARHVRDVDLYHTDLDRDEYNRGLFWHTDHYLDAGLASHRSYSREHLHAKPIEQSGGGPGPEHCYTTGLALHYFQTGDEDFSRAVIDMADWVLLALNGSPTWLGAIQRGVGHVNRWRNCRGTGGLFPRYPLTRGTGNALSACLDAFEVGGGRAFLLRAEELIRGALHPGDDIAARHLLEAETAWSYTVLLASIAKFLDKKSELGEFDAGFFYARASLLAYAEWMLEHERPYLECPDILEYPNETWAAQDLRKGVVFHHAARYAPKELREPLRGKGTFFCQTSREELLRHKTSSFSRPVTLMLQNGWVAGALSEVCEEVFAGAEQVVSGSSTPRLTLGAVAARICSDLMQAAKCSSISRERAWARFRKTK